MKNKKNKKKIASMKGKRNKRLPRFVTDVSRTNVEMLITTLTNAE